MTVTPKEKELAAVGISVAAGCKPCTDHHVGERGGSGILAAADAALAAYLTEPMREQRYLRVWQPVFPDGAGD